MISSFQKKILITLGVLILISSVLLFMALSHQRVSQIVFLDVGQGDAILITTVTGKQVLIDGGKYPNLDVKLAKYMPFYDRSIDLVIATHPDLDHIGGLNTVMENYKVDTFMHSGLLAGVPAYQQLADTIIQSQVNIVTAQAGQQVYLDEYSSIEVLGPHAQIAPLDANEHSMVVKFVYGANTALLTGDASFINETNLVNFYGSHLASDILKLGHHGSKTASSSLFLNTVKPKYAVVSAGCANSFGHPHADVLKRVEQREIEVSDTCKVGDVVFEGDGESWVKGE